MYILQHLAFYSSNLKCSFSCGDHFRSFLIDQNLFKPKIVK
jgi:hypothetical protein